MYLRGVNLHRNALEVLYKYNIKPSMQIFRLTLSALTEPVLFNDNIQKMRNILSETGLNLYNPLEYFLLLFSMFSKGTIFTTSWLWIFFDRTQLTP